MKPACLMANPRVRLKAALRSTFVTLFTLTGVALMWRILFARHAVRILTYHSIETTPSNPFSVSLQNFEQQIAFVVQNFEVIDFATFLRWRRGAWQSKRPKIILTFDDGFADNFAFAAPILEKYEAPATFFVIGSKIDGRDGRFMTTKEAMELLRCDLFAIGCHSLNHCSLRRISDNQKKDEIGVSKSLLESKLDCKISYFCYPYGTFTDIDERSAALLKEHGYSLACTSINGVNFKRTNLFKLHRTKIECSDDMQTFSRILRGAIDGWILIDFFFRFLQGPRVVSFDRNSTAASSQIDDDRAFTESAEQIRRDRR
jgi:peptidoglycan/xylan/chitin deacetylase (PgdA/CDA1 family)